MSSQPTRRPWLEVSADEAAGWLDERGQPAFRLRQIRQWVFARRAERFEEMTDLPMALRRELSEHFRLWAMPVLRRSVAEDATEKLLLDAAGGGGIECVLLRDGTRRSICVSSQVGCAMGCVFCASGLHGVDRNLTSGEILEQMLRLQRLLPEDERLSHIVMMGMGEPLANLDNVLAALSEARAPDGLGISPRRITISTVGLPAAMRRLARENPGYQLAVSLHAADDALRSRLVPVNDATGLEEILAAADEYFDASGRRLTFEYVLLDGVNDSPDDARRLAARLQRRAALLNVIPYNPVADLPYRTPSSGAQQQFRSVLERSGVNVHFRQRKGDKIDAACGQLSRSSRSP